MLNIGLEIDLASRGLDLVSRILGYVSLGIDFVTSGLVKIPGYSLGHSMHA